MHYLIVPMTSVIPLPLDFFQFVSYVKVGGTEKRISDILLAVLIKKALRLSLSLEGPRNL